MSDMKSARSSGVRSLSQRNQPVSPLISLEWSGVEMFHFLRI